MDLPVKSRKLNNFGVKDSANMWRTIKGEHYGQWTSDFDEELIAAYRAAGVRCAKRGDELFVCNKDWDAAAAVDEKMRKVSR
ncbi:hypothetical protein EN759_00490 [Mesorhizobium sp. M00.F.Ca.ET.038.03.1.1]|nr:hypothetical protein EN759_00490 [Mesorhizobium sp. M00.F.Ca.ET.038.03.1.1]TIW04541.1 MAG: hypothetical protein E5V77_00210 [Mesorhizobium sp.]